MRNSRLTWLLALTMPIAGNSALSQQNAVTPDMRARIETQVASTLQKSGNPGAVVALVQHGQVVYTGAFGDARVKPEAKASVEMPYGIGSVSKQFTAAAVMVLVERGKLRLDDPVSTWYPQLAHSHEVTLRNLLNQVSGYADYYTEDYLTPEVASTTTPMALVREWTSKPLGFAPGTRWEYSNTNYLLAALIVEKVSQQPFFEFLQANVLQPAGIEHVVNLDGDKVPPLPVGYCHFGFGPARECPREGKGTLSGGGSLAMPIGELAKWDTVVLKRHVLKPSSWQIMESEFTLPDGTGTGYGMGFFLRVQNGRRTLAHGGELSGFTTQNTVFPAQDTAVAVIVNGDGGAAEIASAIEDIAFAPAAKTPVASDPSTEALVRKVIAQLQQGHVDRKLLAPNLQYYFTKIALADYRNSLQPLGTVVSLETQDRFERGGMYGFSYKVKGSKKDISILVYVTKDGLLDQIMLLR
ncbi:MAG TPA: serine hydrolase domain-containing protein [Edaphobacter sp.]|nr:serine hydrolase domain-containing protein [Edaphobacter sp.]